MGIVLGSGSFAKVFYGTFRGQQVAVKVSSLAVALSSIARPCSPQGHTLCPMTAED